MHHEGQVPNSVARWVRVVQPDFFRVEDIIRTVRGYHTPRFRPGICRRFMICVTRLPLRAVVNYSATMLTVTNILPSRTTTATSHSRNMLDYLRAASEKFNFYGTVPCWLNMSPFQTKTAHVATRSHHTASELQCPPSAPLFHNRNLSPMKRYYSSRQPIFTHTS